MSHTAVSEHDLIDAALIDKTVSRVANAVRERYLYEAVANRVADQLVERASEMTPLRSGQALAARLSQLLSESSNDRHFRVEYWPAKASDGTERLDAHLQLMARDNFGFECLRMLPGGVGVLSLSSFAPLEAARDLADASMLWLSGCRSLILDLRAARGGHACMAAYLASWMLPAEEAPLAEYHYIREQRVVTYGTTVDLPFRLTDLPVRVLTSRSGFSAVEALAYTLQARGRALVIGETTAGGAHAIVELPLGDGFWLMVPVARAIDPLTGSNWEQCGVEPDEVVPAEHALEVAHRRLLEEQRVSGASSLCSRIDRWNALDAEARSETPIQPASGFEGVFGPHRLEERAGELWHNLHTWRERVTLISPVRALCTFKGKQHLELSLSCEPGTPDRLDVLRFEDNARWCFARGS